MSLIYMAQPVPSGLALHRISIGLCSSRALALGAKPGMADLLEDGPRYWEDLAKAIATHGPSLKRVMRLLASMLAPKWAEHWVDSGSSELGFKPDCEPAGRGQ